MKTDHMGKVRYS